MREVLAHVQFRGSIRERSVEPYVRLLKALRSKRRVKGVLFDISSGGGGDIASTDLYLAVKRLDQVKPVFASINSIAASGGYMAALGARRVYAYPDSEVGSIGVIFPHLAIRQLLDRLGIQVELLHQGRHKDAYQGLRPLSDEERTKLMAVAEDSYHSFVEMVARERRRSYEEILPLATGEFWSGRKALELGLVDALADREGVLEALALETGVASQRTVRVAPPRPFLDRLVSGGASSLLGGLRGELTDLLEDALLEGQFGGRR
ncbi:MAG TPA: signal peptide peptidase SppA [Thermoplasmata archaeon]|nr:signal peptide peptidase SppA [Thermoplasmata archaeon]